MQQRERERLAAARRRQKFGLSRDASNVREQKMIKAKSVDFAFALAWGANYCMIKLYSEFEYL
jgi:hypothetical protein